MNARLRYCCDDFRNLTNKQLPIESIFQMKSSERIKNTFVTAISKHQGGILHTDEITISSQYWEPIDPQSLRLAYHHDAGGSRAARWWHEYGSGGAVAVANRQQSHANAVRSVHVSKAWRCRGKTCSIPIRSGHFRRLPQLLNFALRCNTNARIVESLSPFLWLFDRLNASDPMKVSYFWRN